MSVLDEVRDIARKTTKKTKVRKEAAKRKPQIAIGEIDGVIGWGTRRNPLSRSNRSYKSGMIIRTRMNDMEPSLALNDSEIEEAFKIDALLQPNVVGVECQPLTIPLPSKTEKKSRRSHSFDVRITLEDGKVYLAYVKAQRSLRSSSSVATISEIVANTPANLCHRVVVISDVSFSRNYRDNNRRILMCHEMPNAEADRRICELINTEASPLRISALIEKSGLAKSDAWQAILRMIGAGMVGTERDAVIDYPSLIWRPE
ncbi:hypothetical protein [Celeribacter baekdonensis]|uniref:TnsA endonuclease N terminal n=1 Tax=Celeribacter baekdonensis TaxID=875171 RepID=A0A2R4M2Q6_9RHOB|nr:hypothetical protein [Celeribacter baekdonensis]AVW91342.1 hypothetical protein DA792_09830 [Celeribacter baekdonensis]